MNRSRTLTVIGIAAFIFMLMPVFIVMWVSVTSSQFIAIPPEGYSLRWFKSLPENRSLMGGLWYSTWLAVLVSIISVTIGAMAALALGKRRMRGSGAIGGLLILPLILPSIIVGIAIYIAFFQLSTTLGMRLVPSTSALLWGHVLVTLPWTFRLLHSGVVTLGDNLDKASRDLGRGALYTLWHVNLPLLKAPILASFIFAFIFSFGNLEISLFLIEPGGITLPVAMIQYAHLGMDPSLAAIATVQIVLMAVLLWLAGRFVNVGRVMQRT
ncbi:ABC transporter permease subunit [Ornithinimicrobium sp. F0845]|uniref:ABC transporter permease n=1 Tax=Ornithinimicrobium sp. F0845 TaxID=2926412 RepID=UPI001FF6AEF2|nr:ABC transporter permease subunit [Ornithinimicrobium sp. F0845]MCK0112779.1 ABC transporter permease subunit [Ornithinimicrobium sp. F0845]